MLAYVEISHTICLTLAVVVRKCCICNQFVFGFLALLTCWATVKETLWNIFACIHICACTHTVMCTHNEWVHCQFESQTMWKAHMIFVILIPQTIYFACTKKVYFVHQNVQFLSCIWNFTNNQISKRRNVITHLLEGGWGGGCGF